MSEKINELHNHSIYVHCRACHTWGINLPDVRECGNCGNTEDTTVYYPEEVVKALEEQLETAQWNATDWAWKYAKLEVLKK